LIQARNSHTFAKRIQGKCSIVDGHGARFHRRCANGAGRIGAPSVRGLQTIRTTRITSCPVPLLRYVPRCASITICHDHP
jgi:hypothetical protein